METELKEINLTWGEAEKITKNREERKGIVRSSLCPTRDKEDKVTIHT